MNQCELKAKIQDSMKSAMKAQEKERLGVIRMILAAIKQQEVDLRIELTESNIIEILTKMLKKCRESIDQFKAVGREDLINKESFEMQIISEFLPEQLSEQEVQAAIQEALLINSAKSIKDMSKVMQHLRKNLAGKADFDYIGNVVKNLLANQGT